MGHAEAKKKYRISKKSSVLEEVLTEFVKVLVILNNCLSCKRTLGHRMGIANRKGVVCKEDINKSKDSASARAASDENRERTLQMLLV